jgi:ribonuclease P/MRP protein subunit POP5
MVRIKHRYLLINILYPDHLSLQPANPKTNPPAGPQTGQPTPPPPPLLPLVVQFHQPTPDDLTPQVFARIIKDQIALLYGDYGVGVTAGSLNGA